MKKNQNKNIAIFAFSILAMIGTYNAVMINSESHLSDSHQLKRLDEVFGVVKAGRHLAVSTDWRKVSKESPKKQEQVAKIETVNEGTNTESVASIQESLDLKLVEVMNPKKWEKGVAADQFKGSIATNNGMIESLSATLPEGLSVDISFSEMTGNTFEYDLNGEVYSAMMYQVDQSAYMVTLTNGPLEGTRLKFAGETQNSEAFLAENHNVQVQEFGAETEVPTVEASEAVPTQTAEASSFNFNI